MPGLLLDSIFGEGAKELEGCLCLSCCLTLEAGESRLLPFVRFASGVPLAGGVLVLAKGPLVLLLPMKGDC